MNSSQTYYPTSQTLKLIDNLLDNIILSKRIPKISYYNKDHYPFIHGIEEKFKNITEKFNSSSNQKQERVVKQSLKQFLQSITSNLSNQSINYYLKRLQLTQFYESSYKIFQYVKTFREILQFSSKQNFQQSKSLCTANSIGKTQSHRLLNLVNEYQKHNYCKLYLRAINLNNLEDMKNYQSLISTEIKKQIQSILQKYPQHLKLLSRFQSLLITFFIDNQIPDIYYQQQNTYQKDLKVANYLCRVIQLLNRVKKNSQKYGIDFFVLLEFSENNNLQKLKKQLSRLKQELSRILKQLKIKKKYKSEYNNYYQSYLANWNEDTIKDCEIKINQMKFIIQNLSKQLLTNFSQFQNLNPQELLRKNGSRKQLFKQSSNPNLNYQTEIRNLEYQRDKLLSDREALENQKKKIYDQVDNLAQRVYQSKNISQVQFALKQQFLINQSSSLFLKKIIQGFIQLIKKTINSQGNYSSIENEKEQLNQELQLAKITIKNLKDQQIQANRVKFNNQFRYNSNKYQNNAKNLSIFKNIELKIIPETNSKSKNQPITSKIVYPTQQNCHICQKLQQEIFDLKRQIQFIKRFQQSKIIKNFQDKDFILKRITQILLKSKGKDSILQIQRTQLLYRMDLKNKTNFHSYVDNKKNILMLVKTVKGKVLAGFSEDSFQKQGSKQGVGLLLSLDNKQSYQLLSQKKSYKYDSGYIIFGNSQLRIKFGQKILETHIGLKNKHFDTKQLKPGAFIGEDDKTRQTAIQDYQIYQILFKGEVEEQIKQKVPTNLKIKQKSIGNFANGLDKDNDKQILNQKILTEKISQIKKLQQQMEYLQKKISQIENNLQNIKKQKSQILKEVSKKDNQIQILKKQILFRMQQLNKFKYDCQEKQKIIHQKHNNESEKVKEYIKQINTLKSKLDQLSNKNKQQQNQIEGIINKKNQIQTQQMNSISLKKYNQIEQQLSNKIDLIKKMEQHIIELMKNQLIISQQKQQINILQNKLEKIYNDYHDASLEIDRLNEENARILQSKNRDFQKIITLQKTNRNLALQHKYKDQVSLFKLFCGDILQLKFEQKKFLIKQIQTIYKKQIINTKIIYRYDPNRKINFNDYLNDKPNFVFLVQLLNKNIVACYSESSIKKGMDLTGKKGLIMSLTNQKSFKTNSSNKSSKPIIYDQFYIIFGNSQLRIKPNEKTVFSNFGILNNYYETNGQTVDILFGEGAKGKECQFLDYYFYQVLFNE